MTRKQKVVLVAVIATLMVVSSFVFLTVKIMHSKKVVVKSSVTDTPSSSTGSMLLDNSQTSKDISLNNLPKESDNGGLRVSTNIGIGAGLEGSGGTTNSSPSTQSNGPETFAQYDKYKGEKSALFGDISQGSGAEAGMNKKVAIYYKGWLTDGTLFDQSRPEKTGEQPKPLVFEIGAQGVIAGMQQGVIGMKVGGQRRIIIPPAVGYGDKAHGPIPPGSVLVFDVALLAAE